MDILCVVGARPNFIKIIPLLTAFSKAGLDTTLIHTGQHYDYNMSEVFFRDLDIPQPNIHLGVGSQTHARQTAKIMVSIEKVLLERRPRLLLIVGDVNSSLACSLVGSKLHIPIAHVEAGLRSFNMKMPEEINRILIDRVSDYLFTPSEEAGINLMNEGIDKNRVFHVGNVMIDTLLQFKRRALSKDVLTDHGISRKDYAILTIHRPENVDEREPLKNILDAISMISRRLKIVFPIHPRTQKKVRFFGLSGYLKHSSIKIVKPLGYLDFLNLVYNSRFTLTDSGGIQEETTMLDIPCLTLREETERPITILEGTNVIVGRDKAKIIKEAEKILKGKIKKTNGIKLWDGRSAGRIAAILKKDLN